jgi:YfiH family protein
MLKFAASNLERDKAIAHAFFGRTGGVSEGLYSSLNCGPGSEDDREHVVENRRRALASLASIRTKLVTLYQVHGRDTVLAREAWEISRAPRADAMVTDVPGIALGILTADCAPVLFADAEAGVVGAAHAGWKGALAGVIGSAVAGMERLGAKRDRIRAAIGPCISQESYEVGDELRIALASGQPDNAAFFAPAKRAEHWQFDLAGFARAQLHRAGIEDAVLIPACTYLQESDFYSYRRATHRGERDYGRQLSAILLI